MLRFYLVIFFVLFVTATTQIYTYRHTPPLHYAPPIYRQYHQQQDQEDKPQPEQPPRKLAVLLGPRRRRFVLHFNRHAGHGLSLRFHTCLRRTALPWAE